jgi:tetratricopeptide (TPR) repeat protein
VTATGLNAADAYYNLLVRGLRAGQLSLKEEAPPEPAQLADPYDRTANTPHGQLDLSYYKGKFYLYFGATPAVVLFWPCVALTGHYLSQKDAAVIFCVVGFLVSVGLLCALWRRYFAEVGVAVVAAGALALGLATFTPLLLARCDVYEVSVSCGYALMMLALAGIWKALHDPKRRGWWLAAASAAYGLAVGARPNLLFGAVVLLVPVAQAWRERRSVWAVLTAATVPIALIGLVLMFYNARRFDNPFEFGLRYQLAGDRQIATHLFSPRYLWFNFRVFFLEPAHWSGRFPFVHDITAPPLPAGHGRVEHPFGVLTSVPLVWLALAVPLAWRGRPGDLRCTLRGFLAAVALLSVIGTLTVCLFLAACSRYEAEFLSTLVLLAAIGVLSLERTLADRPARRRAARWGWGLLLAFSVAFNLLASVEYCAEAHNNLGSVLSSQGKVHEAIAHYEKAVRLNPDLAEAHFNLGFALAQTGQIEEAIAEYEQALRSKPNYAEVHNNVGDIFLHEGRLSDAIRHYEQALQIKPDYAGAQANLGSALATQGRLQDAITHYGEAVRINPDFAGAYYNRGVIFERVGRLPEAVADYEQALRIKPDYARAHFQLGTALEKMGRTLEAVEHYRQALKLRPDFIPARNALTRLQPGP